MGEVHRSIDLCTNAQNNSKSTEFIGVAGIKINLITHSPATPRSCLYVPEILSSGSLSAGTEVRVGTRVDDSVWVEIRTGVVAIGATTDGRDCRVESLSGNLSQPVTQIKMPITSAGAKR
jgi:hypothetical protein